MTVRTTRPEEPKLLYETNNAIGDVRIYEFKGHKFRIHCHHTNGEWSPTLSIMTADGTWKTIENNITLCFEWENLYFLRGSKHTSSEDIDKMKAQNAIVVKGFLDYIKAVYV